MISLPVKKHQQRNPNWQPWKSIWRKNQTKFPNWRVSWTRFHRHTSLINIRYCQCFIGTTPITRFFRPCKYGAWHIRMFHAMHEHKHYFFSNMEPSIVPLMSDEILMKDKITIGQKVSEISIIFICFFKLTLIIFGTVYTYVCVTKILKSKVMYQRKN